MEERVRSFFSEYGIISLLAIAGVLFLVFGIFSLRSSSSSHPIVVTDTDKNISSDSIFIDVSGAVHKPGIYTLSSGSRVADAIEKAGGVREDADGEFLARVLNQAEKVEDGQKIFIPVKNLTVAGSSSVGGEEVSSSTIININTASESELDTLPGVGVVTAQKIISNRPYSSIEDVKSKKAVNSSTFEKIKDLITIY